LYHRALRSAKGGHCHRVRDMRVDFARFAEASVWVCPDVLGDKAGSRTRIAGGRDALVEDPPC